MCWSKPVGDGESRSEILWLHNEDMEMIVYWVWVSFGQMKQTIAV